MKEIVNFLSNPTPQDIIVVLFLAIISRLSPAGKWNYKRTQWLAKRKGYVRKKR